MLSEMVLSQNFKPESLPVVRLEGVDTNFTCSQVFLLGKDMSKFKRRTPPLCECGCKELVKKHRGKWNRYILGHHIRENNPAKQLKVRKILSEQKMGKNNPMCKYQFTEQQLNKKSEQMIGNQHAKGYKQSLKQRQKRALDITGPNNPQWKGGIAAEPYCDIWLDKDYKEDILARDNHTCQSPLCRDNCNHLPLHRHHIDNNKKNCHPKNIVTLCASCNHRAKGSKKFPRGWWTKFYQGTNDGEIWI